MDASIRDTGITVVYEPDSGCPIVDIVIVHGLQGHPYKTWACKDLHREVLSTTRSCVETPDGVSGSRKSSHRIVARFSGGSSGLSSIDPNLKHGMMKDGGNVKEARVFWPKDLLPIQCPKARILVYGYDTKVTHYLSGPTNETSIHSHGKDLLSSLAAFRKFKLKTRLIFIAHSLGGIVVKEMLASSSSSSENNLRNVVASTAAVIFLGTPHRGSPDLASLGDRARSLISLFRVKTNPAILDALRLKTKDLERAQESFSAVWNQYDFRVKTFKEGLGLTGVNLGPFGRKVVSDDSSLLGDVRERAETIQANHMDMCRFTGLDDPNYSRICGEITHIYDSLAGLEATTAQRVNKDTVTADGLVTPFYESRIGVISEREKTCLQSLVFPNMNQRAQNLDSPAEGTCSWLFKHETFVDWLAHKNQSQSCGLLWLRGKPGSGKSTLLKDAFSRAVMDMKGRECHVTSFFFNAKGEDLEHSPIGMLRSILHQMCSQSPEILGELLEFAQKRRAIRGEDMTAWEEAELRAFLKSAIICQKRRVIIFIDAIDECNSNSVRDVADFWRETTKMTHRVGVELSVCLSSRHFPAVAVKDCPEIIMENHNTSDIAEFVKRRLDLGLTGKNEDQQAIQDKILDRSGGVFLWVSLVMKDILRKSDEGKGLQFLLKHLDTVPLELEDLFCQLLTTVTTGPSSTMVFKMFQWALLPTKPLRLLEWHHVLAFIGDTPPSSLNQWRESDVYTETDEHLEKRITYLSRGLLGFNIKSSNENSHELVDESRSDRAGAGSLDLNTGETRVIQVIHESLRQYFMEGPGFALLNPAFAERPLAHAHLSMMGVCLDYILIQELDALLEARKLACARRSTKSRPTSSCAVSVASFGSAGSHHGTQTLVELKMQHRETQMGDTIPERSRRSCHGKSVRSTSPPAELAASGYLKELSRLARAHDITSSWLRGQSKVDQAHYDKPAAHMSPQTSVTGRSQRLKDHLALLSYAMFELFTHARKADAEGLDPTHIIWRLHDGAWDRWKALREDVDERIDLLYFAADLGLSSWLTADIWEGRHIYLAIELAIENKNAEVFGKLLRAFSSAKCLEDTRSMILRLLASATDAALLQAFLSWLPSKKHSSRGPVTTKQDILASKDEDGRTALHLAIIQQNIAGVSVLLEHNADVSARDYQHRTPLHLACMNQARRTNMFTDGVSTNDGILAWRSDMIKLLLDHDADIDASDEEGRTPLMLACSNSALLSEQDIDDDFVSTEVHPDGEGFDVVELLLKRGANATKRDPMGFLPLHEACWNSSGGRQSKILIVRKLLDCGSPVNATAVGCGTSLHIACDSPDMEIVEELLRWGADSSLRDYDGRSPLHIAVAKSTEQVVETLLSFPGTSVGATDNSGSTPLHLACDTFPIADPDKPRTLSIMRRLLAHGANAYTMHNRNGDSPADLARKYGIVKASELMLKESCDALPR